MDVDKDSSWESTLILRESAGVDNIDHNQSSTTANGFYMAQQYRQGSREWKIHIRVVLLSRNHKMQSDISFLRTREPPRPEGCLMVKPLNVLLPLANSVCVSVLESFVVLMSDHTHTNRSRRVNDARKVLAIFTKGNKPWEPPLYWPCFISSHQERCLQRWTLLGTVLRMGMIKLRVRCVEASEVHLTLNIKRYTRSWAKPNEVVKDFWKCFFLSRNFLHYALQISWRIRVWED